MTGVQTTLPGTDPELVAALRSIARTPQLLVACDFDGTLAPFVDDPEDARPTPEARVAMAELGRLPQTTLALVSGRDVASLQRVAAPPDGTVLIGSHGAESNVDGLDELTLTGEETAQLRALRERLESVVAGFAGARLEHKPAGVALHTRGLGAAESVAAQRAGVDSVEELGGGFTVRDGKSVVEFSVRTETKGDAIRRLAQSVAATATFFAGDDVTDEDAFAALGASDVGVKVGGGATSARYRVADIPELVRVLDFLAAERAADVC